MERHERNYGIDLLRIVSMCMICILHILYQGGILPAVVPFSLRYDTVWLLESASFGAVNCYALISGYVGVRSRFKYSSVVTLWLQVFFYCGIFTLLFSIFAPGTVGEKQIWSVFFPATCNQYWYFTQYLVMALFTPFLNKILDVCKREQIRALIAVLTVLFTVLPFLLVRFTSDPYLNEWGYSAVWLGFLYLVGGYIAKYVRTDRRRWLYPLVYVGCTLFVFGAKYFSDYASARLRMGFLRTRMEFWGMLLNYNSLPVFVGSVALFMFFAGMKVGTFKKVIAFFSPLSFGVYLIHVHPLVFGILLKDLFAKYVNLPSPLLALAVVGTAIGLYLVCSLTDGLRYALFRALKLKERLGVLEKKLIGDLWKDREEELITK